MGKKSTPRRLADNEAKAELRNVRISPIKLNLVAALIRGLKVDKSLANLTFSKQRISNDVKKLLESAVANAENNHGLDVDSLVIVEASVGNGMVMKRFRARAKGRGAKILKPFSNMRIVVREEEEGAE